MKQHLYLITILLLTGCQKKETVEPLQPAGDKVVLIEEFTGKGCTNCPKGNREIDNLLALYDSNLVVVSIHAGTFADPEFFPLGEYDLRTEDGNKIFQMLGPNLGYPSGVIDRKKFNGDFQQGSQSWADLVIQEVAIEPEVDFVVEHNFDTTTRRVRTTINGIARERVEGDLRVSIMLTEDGIVDAQDDFEAGGVVEDYVHNHVFRGMATAFDGDVVATDIDQGEAFERVYDMDVDTAWNAQNASLIIFMSNTRSASDIRVLQATSITLVQ